MKPIAPSCSHCAGVGVIRVPRRTGTLAIRHPTGAAPGVGWCWVACEACKGQGAR